MYSFTKATEIFTKHYHVWNENVNYEVLRYNTHKLRHSNWVLEVGRNLITKIKEKEKISPETINRAEIVFFIHDLWRFYQNNKQRILNNSEFEHWDISAKIAKEEWYDEKIYLAIKYHNKYNLNWLYQESIYWAMNNEDKIETEFLSKIIRDADKLQNMIYTIFNIEWLTVLNSKLISWDINNQILIDISKRKVVNRDNIKTYADDIVWVLFRVYDINFSESIGILNYYGYFEKIINELEKLEWVTQRSISLVKDNLLKYKL